MTSASGGESISISLTSHGPVILYYEFSKLIAPCLYLENSKYKFLYITSLCFLEHTRFPPNYNILRKAMFQMIYFVALDP